MYGKFLPSKHQLKEIANPSIKYRHAYCELVAEHIGNALRLNAKAVTNDHMTLIFHKELIETAHPAVLEMPFYTTRQNEWWGFISTEMTKELSRKGYNAVLKEGRLSVYNKKERGE